MAKKTYELTFRFPGPDAPGYLRRRREILEVMKSEWTEAGIEKMVVYLLQFVAEPKSRKDAREAIENMSRVELGALFIKLLTPEDADPNSSSPSGAGAEV